MSKTLCPVLKQDFVDLNGVPLAGGFLYSYTAGTATPQSTYTDEIGNTPNTNPVVLDSAGRADVWLGSGAYKFVLKDSNGATLWSVDNVTVTSNGAAIGTPNTFTIADNQVSYQNVTSMLVDNTVNRCLVFEYTIIRSDGTNKRREHGWLTCMYDSVAGWILVRNSQGADALNAGAASLAITAGGQVQYQSDSMGGTYAAKMTWQVFSAFASEGI
jgi:hypothetical protein